MTGMTTTPSSVENIGSNKFQLRSWMGSLPDKVRELPLSMIAIPGTHDSATYHLDTTDVFSPDFVVNQKLPPYAKVFDLNKMVSALGPLKLLVHDWGKCLKQNTYQQLMLGIRYFDFRPMAHIGKYKAESSTWNAHALYAHRTSHEFNQIKSFLSSYPSEVVILDMNGDWYDMNDAHFASIEKELKSFGSMLCPKIVPLDLVTYNKLRLHEKCNVIVRYDGASDVPDFAYGKGDIVSKWMNHNKAEVTPCSDADLELYKKLDEYRHWEILEKKKTGEKKHL